MHSDSTADAIVFIMLLFTLLENAERPAATAAGLDLLFTQRDCIQDSATKS